MDVREDLRVMSVVRAFNGDTPPVDTYTLSNLGRFDATDATGQANTAQQLVALQIKQGTSLAPFPIGPVAADVDTLTPMEIPLIIPAELFRWHKCVLRVDFQNYRGTGTTAQNVAGTPITFGVPHGDHNIQPVAGNTFGAAGIATAGTAVPGLDPHFHKTQFGTVPSSFAANMHVFHEGTIGVNDGTASGTINTGSAISFGDTTHVHTAPIKQAVGVDAKLTATLPVHTHPLDQRIPDGPLAPSCTVAINGLLLTSGLVLTSGTRNADGTFAGSFEIDDISQLLQQTAGTTVTITLTPGTGAGNQYGVGRFQFSGTFFGEFGGLNSTVIAS
jgi:hypothetical protein